MTDIIAARRFSLEDQAWFARLSGDCNPMHLDPLAARRTQAGAPVVHGIHALLWALDAAAASGLSIAGVAQIKAQFSTFIPLGCDVALRLVRRDASSLRLAVCVDERQAMALGLRLGPCCEAEAATATGVATEAGQPADLTIDQMGACEGWLEAPVADDAFATAFPAASAGLSAQRLSGLAQTSRLVGMVCPGLHSIYASLTLDFTLGGAGGGIGFRVTKTDERFRLVDLAVWGSGLAGKVSAFARHPPVDAPEMTKIVARVTAGEFAGVTALVVGGSRGLGAVTAKIIAAGGGKVAITYATGREDAEAVCKDIVGYCGAGTCRMVAYDAMLPAAPQLAGDAGWASALYYFATTPIFSAKNGVFAAARLAQFSRIYVDAFYECVSMMSHGGLSVFYPSSIAIEERPAGMLEYSMAKMAGEMLCTELQAHGGRRIVVSRLPRVLTDQTATVARAAYADPIDVMLPLVRAMGAV